MKIKRNRIVCAVTLRQINLTLSKNQFLRLYLYSRARLSVVISDINTDDRRTQVGRMLPEKKSGYSVRTRHRIEILLTKILSSVLATYYIRTHRSDERCSLQDAYVLLLSFTVGK